MTDAQTVDLPTVVDTQRRRFLVAATSVVGAVGTAGVLIPFIGSMNPSQRALVAGAPVEVDISKIEPGQQITVSWRGKPVWVLRRTEEMLERMQQPDQLSRLLDPDSEEISQQPVYAQNQARSIDQQYLVAIAICTHLGCVPTFRPEVAPVDLGADWPGGYFCPCHGSRYDLAGRVYKGQPAPRNLEIPPYRYLDSARLEIGSDPLA